MDTATKTTKATQSGTGGLTIVFIVGKSQGRMDKNPGFTISQRGYAALSRDAAKQFMTVKEMEKGTTIELVAATLDASNKRPRLFLVKNPTGYKFTPARTKNPQTLVCINAKFARFTGACTLEKTLTPIDANRKGYELYPVR